MTTTFEKATAQDTGMLTELRIAYLQEDLKEIQAALIRMGYEKEYQVQTIDRKSVV